MITEILNKTMIDTVGVRIECDSSIEQREILDKLLNYISSNHPFYINHKDNIINHITGRFTREYFIYGSSKLLASITTMSFQVDKKRSKTVYFIKIVWAGLKKYNEFTDRLSLLSMLSICSYLNGELRYNLKLCELDIAQDINEYSENILVLPINRVPNVNYYRPDEEQPFAETTYIEKINIKRKKHLSLRSYVYPKHEREGLDDEVITRFEVALKTAFFSNKSTDFHEILASVQKALNRYAVLRISNFDERNSIVQEYNGIIDSDIKNKSRKLNSLPLDGNRLFFDLNAIEEFLGTVLYIKDFHISMHEDWFVEAVLSKLNC